MRIFLFQVDISINLKKEMGNGKFLKGKAFTIGLDLSPQLTKVGGRVLVLPQVEEINRTPHMKGIRFSYNL